MKPIHRNTILLVVLLALDQILKAIVESSKPGIDLGIAVIHLVKNTGAGFGILQNSNALLIWIVLIILGVIMLNIKQIKKAQELPMMLIITGLLGNLIDRIFRGYVVDFIDFKFWPVFNIADAAITIGVIWLGITILFDKDDEKKTLKKKPAISGKAKKTKK